MTQYVEHLRVPVERHVLRDLRDGKGKKRKVRTACDARFEPDEVIVLSFADTEVNGRAPAPMCRACTGDVEDDREVFTDESSSQPEYSAPATNGKPKKCGLEPPSNGESNQVCTLPDRHTHAHQNGKISWSGEPGVWTPLPHPKALAKRQGVDALLAPTPAPLRLEQLDVDTIERSPLNHRTRFDGIEELGADIKANGLRVPIKVRPNPDAGAPKSKPWQLVYGERRWRAAKAAGVKSLPALIAELDDLAVIKEQLVENVSRSDVHPLEEADGYQALLEKHGYDVERIATETGKSKATIYARLKLISLCPSARVEFFAGRLNASVALLIARIPDVGLQEQATKEVMGEVTTPKYGPDHDALTSEARRLALVVDEEEITGDEDDDPALLVSRGKAVRVPMSVREAQLHLQRRYMLRLELAKFPIDDATLDPVAGACTTCEFRTGNQRELFADVASADVCTKPDCYANKARLEGERRAREAEAKGARVVAGKAAEKVFAKERGGDGMHLGKDIAGASPYVDPRDSIGYGLAGGYNSKISGDTSWDKLLGKKLAKEVPSVVVVHPETGEARELLDKGKAIEVLRKAGKLPKPKKENSTGHKYDPDRWEREQKKRDRERAIRDNALRSLLTEDVFPIACGLEDLDECPRGTGELVKWLRWVIASIVEIGRSYSLITAELHLGDPKASKGDLTGKLFDRFIAEIKDPDRAQGVLTSMLIEELAPYDLAGKGDRFDLFDQGLKLMGCGVQWKKHIEAAKKKQAELDKAEAAAKAKEEKKAPAKKPAKKKGRKS